MEGAGAQMSAMRTTESRMQFSGVEVKGFGEEGEKDGVGGFGGGVSGSVGAF
jgi:hypothetical protein